MKVCKFGGSSLADVGQIKKVMKIISSDPQRKVIVVSAPGKRHAKDIKITDLLIETHRFYTTDRKALLKGNCSPLQNEIKHRFEDIILGIGIEFDLNKEIAVITDRLEECPSLDYVVSRGEYLMGKILAEAIGFEFFDPMDCITIDENRNFCGDYQKLWYKLTTRDVVIPGFYGVSPTGEIRTFSRGGSDVTGAIIARAMKASVYENWTDVNGILMADPRIVSNPQKIEIVTYDELRELSYMGANVFHEEAMFPVQDVGIPTNIRNTNDPKNSGTMVVVKQGGDTQRKCSGPVTGIAGKKDFVTITVKKRLMNQQVAFVRKMLTVLEDHKISFEHPPSSIDSVSIIIDPKYFRKSDETKNTELLDMVKSEINNVCSPDLIDITEDLALIAIVGVGMIHTPGIAATATVALAKENINIRVLNQGASEINIIIGVANSDYEGAIRAIYGAFAQ